MNVKKSTALYKIYVTENGGKEGRMLQCLIFGGFS